VVAIFLAGGHRTVRSYGSGNCSTGGSGEAEAFSLNYTLILNFF